MPSAESRGAVLHVLGAGSIVPALGRGCSGYALEPEPGGEVTLLDCGPGSVRRLPEVGIELERVRRVVFSHFHLDHCLDLYALAFARRNPGFGPAPPLEIVGPPGLTAFVNEAPATFADWARDPNASVREIRLDEDDRAAFESGGLRFRCTRNGHTKSLVPLSWRVESPDAWSLAYTGDTNEDERVSALARGVSLFVAECSFPDEEAQPNHLSPSSAARLARAAGASRLLLTHFYPSNDPEAARERAAQTFLGPIEIARDGSSHGIRCIGAAD